MCVEGRDNFHIRKDKWSMPELDSNHHVEHTWKKKTLAFCIIIWDSSKQKAEVFLTLEHIFPLHVKWLSSNFIMKLLIEALGSTSGH